jgi:hypothetical protein
MQQHFAAGKLYRKLYLEEYNLTGPVYEPYAFAQHAALSASPPPFSLN